MSKNREGEVRLRAPVVLAGCLLVLLLVLQAPAAADPYVGGIPLTTVQSGVVSGDLFIDATVPSFGQTTVTKKVALPTYTQIRWARLYVVVYCGHMQNNYNGTVTVSFDENGDGTYETVLGTERLDVPFTYLADGGPGYVTVNSHTNRVTSDYVMWYDVASRITSRNPGIRVETTRLNPSFDGRIKAVTLVVAYDDGDADRVWYIVNEGHDSDTYYSDEWLGEDYRGETSFDLSGLSGEIEKATLRVNHLASQDGFYRFNRDDLDGGQVQGPYFGHNSWDVTDLVRPDGSNLLSYDRYGATGSGFEGQFYKIILATLTVREGAEPDEEPDDDERDDLSGSTGGSGPGPVPLFGNGYAGQAIPAAIAGMVNGSVAVLETSEYTDLILPGDSREFTFAIPLEAGALARLARLSVYTTMGHNERTKEGLAGPAPLILEYGGAAIPAAAHYTDRKGFGEDDYPVETFVYDIRDLVLDAGEYTFTVQNTGRGNEVFAVYGGMLVIAAETDGTTPTHYWIAEGSDIVLADPASDTTTTDATTAFTFTGVPGAGSSGHLYLISTAANGTPGSENLVTFNQGGWDNLLACGPEAVCVAGLEVSDLLRPGENEATIQSVLTREPGDYLENRGAVLVVVPHDAARAGPARTAPPPTVAAEPESPPATLPVPSGEPRGILDRLFRFLFGPFLPNPVLPEEPAPQTVTLPSEVTLTIFTDPEGARVTVNGVAYDDLTPLALVVSRGELQQVTVTLDGYDPFRTALAPAADADLHIVFTPFVPDKPAPSVLFSPENGRLGGVYVESYPSEATIIVDGRKTDQVTPRVIYGLREGYHTVGVEKKNTAYPPAQRVAVGAGTIVPVRFTDGAVFARTLDITSDDVAGASFTVNGVGPSRTIPATEVPVSGTYPYLVIFHEGSYLSRTVHPNLASGSVMRIRTEPADRVPLSVVVSSDPSGSEIFFDGFPTGLRTPAVITNVSPGLHRVMVQAPGFLPGERDLHLYDVVNDLIDEKVFIRLEPYPHGSLNLTSSPPGARVYLSGRNTGERTPVTLPYLPIGLYSVRLLGEHESRTYEVVVTPGQEKGVHAVFPV